MHYEKRHADQIVTAVENGIPLAIGTAGIGGATTPMTIAGNVVHCFASDLAGLVLSQLVSKGSFCMIGSVIIFMDPQTGNVGVLNESTLAELVKCQIGRHWDVPLFNANSGLNMGLEFNQEAVLGLAVSMTAGIFSQATCNYLLGSIEGTITFSTHALLLCHELMGTARRIWKGVTVDDDTLAMEVTREVGPGGNFLEEMHTAVHCRKELSPIKYFVSKTYDGWVRDGRKDLKDVIGEDIQKILKTHVPQPLSPELRQKFNGILTEYGIPGLSEK
jgi:trimethylamine--corrinoid protein Co-methyltransferase